MRLWKFSVCCTRVELSECRLSNSWLRGARASDTGFFRVLLKARLAGYVGTSVENLELQTGDAINVTSKATVPKKATSIADKICRHGSLVGIHNYDETLALSRLSDFTGLQLRNLT